MRRHVVLGLLCAACFEDSTSESGGATQSGTTDGAATTSDVGSDAESSIPDATTAIDTTTTAGDTTETSPADDTRGDDSTTAGPATCTWPLEWTTTEVKDVLVVVTTVPQNHGALLTLAETEATDAGPHILVASSCDPAASNCGAEVDGYAYEQLTVGNGDPLQAADGVTIPAGLFRPFVPKRVVLVTTMDTAWTSEMLAAHPLFAGAALDVRIPDDAAGCGQTALQQLASETNGSFICNGILGAAQILDDMHVLGSQPACELFGNAARGPGRDVIGLELALTGTIEGVAARLVPDGPGVCENDPAQWTAVDPLLGHLALCPAACRDAGPLDDGSLLATATFPCAD